MYKVIIVDDEELHRRGFRSFMPWEELGFNVVDEFSDGQAAIEYISTHEIDLVFSDIKMVHMSGIDIAKHIYENNLDISVCLISGYKDFEYAKQAIYYGVEYYLTKPTIFEEVISVLRQIKNKLDEKQQAKRRTKEYLELLEVAKHQIFFDIFTGNYESKEEIMQKAKLLNINCEKGLYCPFWILINDYENYLKTKWKYDKECFFTAIFNFTNNTDGQFSVKNIMTSNSELLFVATTDTLEDANNFKNLVVQHLENTKQSMKALISLDIKYHTGRVFEGLSEFIDYLALPAWLESDKFLSELHGVADERSYLILPEICKNIMQSIFLKRPSQIDNNLNRIIDILSTSSFDVQKSTIDKFVKIILEKVDKSDDEDLFIYLKGELDELDGCTDVKQLINISRNILITVMELVNNHSSENSTAKIIKQAKQFIEQNYMYDISLDDVADAVYLNATYFSRFFKQHTGENFRTYLIKFRIEQAIRLIHQGKYKIYEISEMVGYKNSKYFASQFKQITGLTPKEYSMIYDSQAEKSCSCTDKKGEH